MPIGLTAQGELVFPMTCQELMERHRSAVAFSSTTETVPLIKENQVVESVEPEKSRNAANQPAELPNTTATGYTGDFPKIGEVKPSDPTSGPDTTAKTLSSREKDVHTDLSHRHGGEVGHNDASSPSAIKPNAPQSQPTVRRPERQLAQSQGSRLVRMTLRTIEFSDGHREQRLLPTRPSRMAVDAADRWYNALGWR
jgi:hypothetical protein